MNNITNKNLKNFYLKLDKYFKDKVKTKGINLKELKSINFKIGESFKNLKKQTERRI